MTPFAVAAVALLLSGCVTVNDTTTVSVRVDGDVRIETRLECHAIERR